MTHMSHICSHLKVKVKGQGHHLAKFHNWSSVRDIKCKKDEQTIFQSYSVTLTFDQGQYMSFHFEGHAIDYPFTEVHNSNIHSARDIQGKKTAKTCLFPHFKLILWPWTLVKFVIWHIIVTVFWQATFWLSFITLLKTMQEILLKKSKKAHFPQF